MIVEYDETGRIFHVMQDPVPAHMVEFMTEEGKTFLNLEPVPWPEEPQFDENNEPLMELVFDENGDPVMDELVSESWEVYKVQRQKQMWASNGVDYADVNIMRDYVVDGEVVHRPENPTEVSVEGFVISLSGTLEGSNVSVILDGITIEVDPSETTLELDEPGLVKIRITPPWPYLEGVYDVEIK